MERLKKVIERYGRWSKLTSYTDRIDAYKSTDFSHAIENAKALLETISKKICKSKGMELRGTPNMNVVMKKAFTAIGYSNDNLVTQISSALATTGQNVGELRNDISPTFHGKSLKELNERNNKVDELTKEFLIDTTVIIASLTYWRSIGTKDLIDRQSRLMIFGMIHIVSLRWVIDYSYKASEILFYTDNKAYLTELKAFMEGEG